MTEYSNEQDFLTAFFSDETERFRSPAEPDPGQTVSVRLRAPKVRGGISVMLIAETIRKKTGEDVLDRVTPMKRIFFAPISVFSRSAEASARSSRSEVSSPLNVTVSPERPEDSRNLSMDVVLPDWRGP